MSKRWIKPREVSAAEDKFAQYLRQFYKISVQFPMRYEEFEPKYDQVIWKIHPIDIMLDDYELPVELLGPHHLKLRQEQKDERIFKEMKRQYRKKPMLIYYDGKEPSKKKMRSWHRQIKERTGE